MRTRHVLFGILLSCALELGAVAGAAAQGAVSLAPGTRLRVTVASPAEARAIGRYQALTDSTLVLAARAIPLPIITRVERSAGRRPGVAAGIAGLLLGAGIGGVLGCAANSDSYGAFCAGQSDTKVVVGAVLGGLTGGAIGAFAFRRERWEPLDLRGLQRTSDR